MSSAALRSSVKKAPFKQRFQSPPCLNRGDMTLWYLRETPARADRKKTPTSLTI